MEDNRNARDKNIIILLLVIIIVILVALIVLFYNNVISFNFSNEKIDDGNILEVNDNNEEGEAAKFEITYDEENYITKNDNGDVIFENTRNLPVISSESNQDSADKIVNTLTKISDEEWNNNIKKTSDEFKDSPYYAGLGINYLFSTGVVNDNRLSFLLTMSGSFGGVTWDGIEGYNFDATTGELLTLDNISLDYDSFRNVLYNKVIYYLENNYDTSEFLTYDCSSDKCVDITWQELVDKNLDNNDIWYFTDSGITIKFSKYYLTNGAAGIISVDIDKNDINTYLKDEYKI